jgi:hypothetical protein
MIRSLKALSLGVLALVALGAAVASSAQASEFHCSAEPCKWLLKPDGTVGSATAHQVIVFKNKTGETITVTCEQLEGQDPNTTKTTSELLFSSLQYKECDDAGQPVTSSSNGCAFRMTPGGTLSIKFCTNPFGFTLSATCTVFLKEATNLNGLAFHNIGSEAKSTTEMTVEMKIAGMPAGIAGNKGECPIDPTQTPITAEITTGNVLVTGQTSAGVMGNAWWA